MDCDTEGEERVVTTPSGAPVSPLSRKSRQSRKRTETADKIAHKLEDKRVPQSRPQIRPLVLEEAGLDVRIGNNIERASFQITMDARKLSVCAVKEALEGRGAHRAGQDVKIAPASARELRRPQTARPLRPLSGRPQ